MEQRLARKVLAVTYAADRAFVKMLRLVQAEATADEFVAFRAKVAPLVADLFLEVMDPLFRQHLDLVPDRYRDHYAKLIQPTTKQSRPASVSAKKRRSATPRKKKKAK